MKKLLLTAAIAAFLTGPASAYTAYLMPDDFLPEDRSVSLDAAYGTTFFTPALALGAEFKVVMPDGSEGYLSEVQVAGQVTELTGRLQDPGTYRFSTGEQLGQVANMVGVDGGWRALQAGETPPEGAPTTTLQTVTVAETYVTLGEPTQEAVEQPAGRLALRPITHPNQVLAGQGFQIQALFDGAPFANTALVVYRAGEPETDQHRYFATDANGNATLALEGPGEYIVVARHRADAAPGSAAAVQSFTTSLTFEAFDVLPPIVEVPGVESEQQRRRRQRQLTRDRMRR